MDKDQETYFDNPWPKCSGDECCPYSSHHACKMVECSHGKVHSLAESIEELKREHPDWNIHR